MSPFQAPTKFSPPSPAESPPWSAAFKSSSKSSQDYPLTLMAGAVVFSSIGLSLTHNLHLLVADKPIAKIQKRVPSNNELILISRYQIGCNCKNALSLNLHETVRTFFLPRNLLTICKHSPSSILTASIKNLFVFSMSSPQAAELHQTGRKCLEHYFKTFAIDRSR